MSDCAPLRRGTVSTFGGATNFVIGSSVFTLMTSGGSTTISCPDGGKVKLSDDQSSAAVMTGTMNPQPTVSNFLYAPSELPGTYAAATIGNSDPGLALTVDNLLLTSPGGATYNVAGTQNPGSVPLTGSYTLTDTGVGTITLTAPSAATYAIYAIDATTVANPADSSIPNFAITDFMMIGTCAPQPCSGTPGSIIFAQQ